MTSPLPIAIVGAGPGGLSAAARAAEMGIAHIVLEAGDAPARTIRHYQAGKWVMDEPASLPLRASLPFRAAAKEAVLAAWREVDLPLQCQWEVVEIRGEAGDFTLVSRAGETVRAARVILSPGLQANPRQLRIPGESPSVVVYGLEDPAAFRDRTIVVVGAGDAAVENALALAQHNTVILLNRREEFIRPTQANLDAVLTAIRQEKIDCFYNTVATRIGTSEGDPPWVLTVTTPEGEARIPCHHVIARLGANPPREFLERCGVACRGDAPLLDGQYQSSRPGIYVIGSVAGYPLIKQALNQGFEVVETLRGHPVPPADEDLLRVKFQHMPAFHSVAISLQAIPVNMPLLAGLSPLQLRELVLASQLHLPQPGAVIFHYNDYSDTFFCILSGEVRVQVDRANPSKVITLRQGQFFGEMSLISGRRRTATVLAGGGVQCALLEIPRRVMNKLIHSVDAVRDAIDRVFVQRAIQAHIAPEVPASDLAAVVQSARIEHYPAGTVLFREGDAGDCLHLIRKGTVMIARNLGGRETVLSYLAAGNYLGEMALLSDAPRSATARAAVETETIRLDGEAFKALMDRSAPLRHQIETKFQERLASNARMAAQPNAGNVLAFLMAQGLGEATEVVLIDEDLCVNCNHCERACADTHAGTSRLNRLAGPSFASVRVPTSCRHCEHPHCMKDCPPDAIHRAPNGEVFIADNCIGCGKCQENCPYGVIRMAVKKRRVTPFAAWLLFGLGQAPGEGRELPDGDMQAVKCDLCKELPGGPACVRACPTGAAFRANGETFLELANSRA